MKRRYFSIIFASIMLSSVLMNDNYINAADSKTEEKEFTLTAEADPENNCINLKWSRNNLGDNSEPYSYMLYSKENGKEGEYFQSIPCKEKVNVLNIYPTLGGDLKNWMKEPALEIATGDKYDVELKITKRVDRKAGDPVTYIDESVKYNYIKDIEGNFITNGRGVIQPNPNDVTKPYKINDSYVYARDGKGNKRTELINVESIDIDDFNSYSNEKVNWK